MKKRSLEQQLRVDQQNRYDEMHTQQIMLNLNKKTDADILEWISTQRYSRSTSVQREIKRLIRQKIAHPSQICVGVHRQDSADVPATSHPPSDSVPRGLSPRPP